MSDEEARAAAYRASLARGRAARVARAASLRGNPTAARQVREDWQAIRDLTQEGGFDGRQESR